MAVSSGVRAIPNIISASRLVLAAAFVAADDSGSRLALVTAAAVTDFLDGFIARHAKLSSPAGALIDPIADRVFALVAVTTFLLEGQLSTLGYFVMIARDLMTAVGFLVARTVSWLRPVQFKARFSGKLVTALQFAAFIAILRWPQWVTPLLWAIGATSVIAIVDYTLALWRGRAR